MSTDYEKHCTNCLYANKGISEEPCIKCRRVYDDRWEPIAPKIIEAAKMIKAYCSEVDCVECPFYTSGKAPVCLLSPDDYNPTTWRI